MVGLAELLGFGRPKRPGYMQEEPPMAPGLGAVPSGAPAAPMAEEPQGGVGEDIIASSRLPLEHKGMFGIKGTPRNILGVLGDAFLVQAGKDPLYMNTRRNERYADAMLNFNEDPIAATIQARAIDPKRANEDYDTYVDNLREAGKARGEAEKRGRDIRKADYDFEQDVLDRGARLFQGKVNAENYPQFKKLYEEFVSSRGVTPRKLPDVYNADEVQNLLSTAVSVEDTTRLKSNEAYRDALTEDRALGRQIQAANAMTGAANARSSAARVIIDANESPSRINARDRSNRGGKGGTPLPTSRSGKMPRPRTDGTKNGQRARDPRTNEVVWVWKETSPGKGVWVEPNR